MQNCAIIISTIAGILLKPQDFHFFVQYNSCDTEISDTLFGSEYKREIKFLKLPTTIRFSCDGTSEW